MTSSKAETDRRGFMQFVAGSAAITALPQIPLNATETTGPPAPAEIRAALKDLDDYVQRAVKTIANQLEGA